MNRRRGTNQPMTLQTFLSCVRHELREQNITHDFLALCCAEEGLTTRKVKAIVRGRRVPTHEEAHGIAATLGLILPAQLDF